VERIDIEGNTTTLDRVIRRQFDSVEGDPFNPREIRESAERIRALDYFETAQVNARQGSSPEQVVVDVDVVEQPTGSLNFGGSFSNNDGIGVAISFAETNFLGRGQQLSLSVSTASEATRYGLNFVEPNLLGRDVAFGLRLDYAETSSSFTNFDTNRLIFQPSLTFPLSENGRLSLRYTAEQNEIVRQDDPVNGPVIDGDIAAGDLLSSSIGYEYTYDTRRGGLDPTSGVLFQFGQDFAGLGGDNKFVKTTAKLVGEKKIFNEDVTLRATLEGGALAWKSGTNRVVDRFLLTPSIMRGFEPGGIGPRDLTGGADDPLGGNLYVVARFEAEFPLGLPEEYGISGGVFYDVGNLWDLSDVNVGGATIAGESGLVSPFAQGLSAQEVTVPNRGTLISPILTIDSDRMFRESVFGKRVTAQITAERNELASENTAIRQALEAEEKELTEKRSTMDPETFRTLADAFDAKVQETEATQIAKLQALTKFEEEERRRFQAASTPVLVQLMRGAGAAVILERQSVFVSATAIEITDRAISMLDDTLGDGAAGAD